MTKIEQFIENMEQLFRESQGIALTKTYLSNIKLIINKDLKSLIEERDKSWLKAIQETFPQAELTTATDIDIKHYADELLEKHSEVWEKLSKL